MLCAILKNQATTIKIKSLALFNLGKSKTKSIKIYIKGSLGTGEGVYKLCSKILDLAFLRIMHLSRIL
jgi:hypothetical protein